MVSCLSSLSVEWHPFRPCRVEFRGRVLCNAQVPNLIEILWYLLS